MAHLAIAVVDLVASVVQLSHLPDILHGIILLGAHFINKQAATTGDHVTTVRSAFLAAWRIPLISAYGAWMA